MPAEANKTNQQYGFGHSFEIFTVGLSKERGLPDTVGLLKAAPYGVRVMSDYRGFIADGPGNWYNISANGELGGVLFLKTVTNLQAPFFPWMTEEEYKDIETINVDPLYTESMEMLLRLAIKESPIGKIYVYIRHQSNIGAFNVAGTLSASRFMNEVVCKQRLLSNFIYILSDDADTDLPALVNNTLRECPADGNFIS